MMLRVDLGTDMKMDMCLKEIGIVTLVSNEVRCGSRNRHEMDMCLKEIGIVKVETPMTDNLSISA